MKLGSCVFVHIYKYVKYKLSPFIFPPLITFLTLLYTLNISAIKFFYKAVVIPTNVCVYNFLKNVTAVPQFEPSQQNIYNDLTELDS